MGEDKVEVVEEDEEEEEEEAHKRVLFIGIN